MQIGNTSVRVLTIAAALSAIGLSGVAGADPTGSHLLKDLIPGTSSGFSYSTITLTSGNTAFMRTPNNALWRTNGRPGGTTQIDVGVTMAPVAVPTGGIAYMRSNATGGTSLHFIGANGTSTQIAQPVITIPTPRGSMAAITVGSRVIFAVGSTQFRSWDSLTGQMEDLGTSFFPGTSADVLVVGSKAYALSTSSPAKLHVTDGTAAGTGLIGEFTGNVPYMLSGRTPQLLLNGGDGVCFVVRETATNQLKMCGSDGTAAATRVLGTMPNLTGMVSTWSSQGSLGIYASGIATNAPGNRSQLWHFGTTANDTGLLLDFPSGTQFINIGSANGMNVFADTGQGTYTGPNSTARMWITNGTPGNTFIGPFVSVSQEFTNTTTGGAVSSAAGGGGSAVNGDEVYFFGANTTTGVEPWRFNTVTGELGMLGEMAPGSASASLARLFPLGFQHGVGVMSLSNPGAAVGSGPGISFFRNGVPRVHVPISGLSSSSMPIAIGNRIIFAASASGVGTEPHAIDLCPADHDNSGTLDSGDVFGFLNEWLANDANADFDRSGGALSVGDIFGFLNGWISGCP